MMHPIIVLEGPDGVGKTTLALKLAESLGGHYMHLTYRFPKQMFNYHTAAIEQVLRRAERQPVILDRWWPSELIYAQAFRGGSPWSHGSRMLDRVGLKHGVYYVFALPANKERYLDFYRKNKEADEDVPGNRSIVYDLYARMIQRFVGRKDAFWYDMHEVPLRYLNETADAITFAAKVNAVLPTHFASRIDRRFAGNPRGKHLLVGDQSNPKTRRAVWPFFEHGNSSLWLTQALEKAAVDEYDLAWVNINGPDGRLQVTPEELDGSWNIISLGVRAKDTLINMGIQPDIVLGHPQYYRRFNPGFDLSTVGLIQRGAAYVEAGRNLGLA